MLGASVIDLFTSGKNKIFFNERESYEQSGQKKRKVTCRVKERLYTSRLIASADPSVSPNFAQFLVSNFHFLLKREGKVADYEESRGVMKNLRANCLQVKVFLHNEGQC